MLREVWLNIGVEKIDTHESIMIKALLDSGATGMFMDRQIEARHGFKLQKLERPIAVRNVDGTNNSGGAITVRATGAPDSRRILSNITVCNYDTTHLQENSQRLG